MSYDTVRNSLQKAKAVLEAATPLNLDERDLDRMTWLIHAAADYVEEALEDLDADARPGQKAGAGEGQP
jgi:uncharacterized protein (DUF1778 family)